MANNNSNDETLLTPEQAAQNLRAAQESKTRIDAQFAAEEEKVQQAIAERRELNSAKAFKEAVRATGIQFHFEDLRELKMVLGSKYDLETSNDGTFFKVTDADGRILTIENALEELATSSSYLVKSGNEHLRPRSENGTFTDVVRDDFTSYAAKSRWVKEHSLAEWEAMPQHRAPKVTAAQMTRSQYNTLSRAEKSRLLGEVGETGLTAILSRNY
jgi:myosin heavy subunit